MKCLWSCFKFGRKYQEYIGKFLLPRQGNEATFSRFSTFQNLGHSQYLQKYSSKPLPIYWWSQEKTMEQLCQVSVTEEMY